MQQVQIKTKLGDIVLMLDDNKAPKTVNYFCDLIKKGVYQNSHFYRVVKKNLIAGKTPTIDIIQGGVGWGNAGDLPTVKLESTKETGITHKKGTISLAQEIPGTSTPEFFICLSDGPALDYGNSKGKGINGFAAFGNVIRGMEVVSEVYNAPANSCPPDGDTRFENEFLDKPLDVISIELKD